MLGAVLLKEGITLDELNEKLIDDLDRTASDRFERDEPHQKMGLNTLRQAQEKTTDEHYLMSYLLDRWSRVTGGPRTPLVLKGMFEAKPQIGIAIEKIRCVHYVTVYM